MVSTNKRETDFVLYKKYHFFNSVAETIQDV